MKCSICNINDADITIASHKENKNRQISICKNCLEKTGIPGDLINNTCDDSEQTEKQSYKVEYDLKCPHCLTEISDFLATGQTGCPQCYHVFKKEIDIFFRFRINIVKPHQKFNYLSDQLYHAIEDENYEYAANLRDRIKVLSAGDTNEFFEN